MGVTEYYRDGQRQAEASQVIGTKEYAALKAEILWRLEQAKSASAPLRNVELLQRLLAQESDTGPKEKIAKPTDKEPRKKKVQGSDAEQEPALRGGGDKAQAEKGENVDQAKKDAVSKVPLSSAERVALVKHGLSFHVPSAGLPEPVDKDYRAPVDPVELGPYVAEWMAARLIRAHAIYTDPVMAGHYNGQSPSQITAGLLELAASDILCDPLAVSTAAEIAALLDIASAALGSVDKSRRPPPMRARARRLAQPGKTPVPFKIYAQKGASLAAVEADICGWFAAFDKDDSGRYVVVSACLFKDGDKDDTVAAEVKETLPSIPAEAGQMLKRILDGKKLGKSEAERELDLYV